MKKSEEYLKILLKDSYRYLSEYLLTLEYHDPKMVISEEKINKIKKLKDEINDII